MKRRPWRVRPGRLEQRTVDLIRPGDGTDDAWSDRGCAYVMDAEAALDLGLELARVAREVLGPRVKPRPIIIQLQRLHVDLADGRRLALIEEVRAGVHGWTAREMLGSEAADGRGEDA